MVEEEVSLSATKALVLVEGLSVVLASGVTSANIAHMGPSLPSGEERLIC